MVAARLLGQTPTPGEIDASVFLSLHFGGSRPLGPRASPGLSEGGQAPLNFRFCYLYSTVSFISRPCQPHDISDPKVSL